MFALGFGEILVLALLSGGMSSTDLVSLIQPTHYFKSRQIEPTVDLMIDYALTEPKTAKLHVRQLVALRYIADEADAFKKAKNYATNRLAIEEVASGKSAQDPQGFAKEYANKILDKLDGKKAILAKPRPLRDEAFTWFPANVKIGYALDLSGAPDMPNDGLKEMMKLMPDQAKAKMYEIVEKVGNMRLERIALGMVDAAKRDDKKIFIRITGKANPAWLTDLILSEGGNFQARQIKDADGKKISLLQDRNRAPIMMLVDDTDLLIVGYQKSDGNHDDLVTEVLDVRAKKKPAASTGLLKDRLAKIPAKAFGIVVGDIPEDIKGELGRLVDPLPPNITAYVERSPMGMELKFESTFPNADDASKAVGKIAELRKKGIDGLQEAMKKPLPPGSPVVPFQAMIAVVEGIQVQNQGERLLVGGHVPGSLLRQLGAMAASFGARDFGPPPLEKQ